MDGLPVECIATIISLTNPRDACCFASISRTFNSAANSDLVWDRFLPSDYRNILAQFDGGDHHQSLLDSSTSKKHLYMNLVDTPLLIDGGMMVISSCCSGSFNSTLHIYEYFFQIVNQRI